MGIMEGKIDNIDYNIKEINKWEFHNGLFLYRVTSTEVTLDKTFLFAEKDTAKYPKEVLEKFLKPLEKKSEYIEQELSHISQIGEYNGTSEVWETNNAMLNNHYKDVIDYKETDEEYVDKLRKEREDKRLLALKQKDQNTRSFMHRYTEKNNDDDEEEILARLDTEEKEERKRKQNEELKKQGLIDDAEPLADVPRLTNMIERYPGFDIPYKAEYQSEFLNFLTQNHETKTVREEENTEKALSEIQNYIKTIGAPPSGSSRRSSPFKANSSLI